jgi:2-oxoisovalerate dehydrogenase E2 component (dihydrolipoyl transacylase)
MCSVTIAFNTVAHVTFSYTTTLDLTALDALLPTFNKHIPSHYLPAPTAPSVPPLVSPSSVYPAPSAPVVPPEGTYTRLTYLPVLLKMLSKSMMAWPIFRSSIAPTPAADAKPALVVRPHVDIAVALSTPTGLYTPTIPAVDTHSVYSLASIIKSFSHHGRQTPPTLPAYSNKSATLSVSNIGAVGAGESAVPILVPGGGVAIVAIGRAKWVWDVNRRSDGQGERRLQVSVSWSADHRVVEGAELAAFVEHWRGYVENPERMIVEGI